MTVGSQIYNPLSLPPAADPAEARTAELFGEEGQS